MAIPACCTLGFPLNATELYSWHSVDAPVPVSSRVQVVLHSRLRTRHEISSLDQWRWGTILRFSARRVTPFVGYYFQPQHIPEEPWIKGHRLFTGVEMPFQPRRNLSLRTRLAAERYLGTGRADYNRYRSYARLVWGGGRRVAPYLQHELLAVRQGFHSSRSSGGLIFRLDRHWFLETGYLYDVRRPEWGGDRQAIVTGVRYEWTAPR